MPVSPFELKPLQYGCLWYGLHWALNLISKGVKEPSEPERRAKAHEVRRSAELIKIETALYYVFEFEIETSSNDLGVLIGFFT